MKKLMDQMGDVVKKTDEAERAFDLQILNEALRKEKNAEEQEKQEKLKAMSRHKQLQIGLKQ